MQPNDLLTISSQPKPRNEVRPALRQLMAILEHADEVVISG